MNQRLYPALTLVCGASQIALLSYRSPWMAGAAAGAALVGILMLFAWTRLRWNSHLDMYLLMLGPGGLGMILGGWQAGPVCHNATWTSFWLMTFGMLAPSLPLCWRYARCIQDARREHRAFAALALDSAGMQLGMTLGHLPTAWIAVLDPRLVWLHHGLMLAGMLLGMLAAAAVQSAGGFKWIREPSASAATRHRPYA